MQLHNDEEVNLFNTNNFDTVHGKPLKEYDLAPPISPLDEWEDSL